MCMHSEAQALVTAAFCLHLVHWKGPVQASSFSSEYTPPLVTVASTPVESSAGREGLQQMAGVCWSMH